MRIQTLLVGALALLLVAGGAQGVESLSTPELAGHCASYQDDRQSKDAIVRIRSVQGFVDGAVATDAVFSTLRREYPGNLEGGG